MQVSVTLNNSFSYLTTLRNILVLILVIVIIIMLLRKYVFKPKKKIVNKPTIDLLSIKRKYTSELDKILNENMKEREKYKILSDILRSFVTEITGINVKNKTLTEISQMGNPIITNLIQEFYIPEFSLIEGFSVEDSISKTKEVISTWR